MHTALVTVLLLAVRLGAAVEHDTLICYGDQVETVIGGSTEPTNVNYHCGSCKQATLCPQGTTFQLTEQYIHVFQGGYVSQSPIALPQDCQPLRIVELDPDYKTEYIVQCASTPPHYNPRRQHIYRQIKETNFVIDGDIVEERSVQISAPFPDNNVLIILHSELYIVSFLADSNVILVHYYDNVPMTIIECSNITKLTAGPVVDSNLQLIVDCIDTNGIFTRKRVLVADNLRTPPSVENLPGTSVSNDVVSFSPDGRYILDVSISQLTIVQVNELTGVPGILRFNGPIAQSIFITNTLLLVTIPGEKRKVLDIPQFFSTSFEAGRYELPDSEAICPQGECPPVVFSNGTLYVFSADGSYQLLSAYDINDPTASPKRINRVQRTAIYDFCFPVTADISVIDPMNPPPAPTPPTLVKPSVTVPSLNHFLQEQIAEIIIGSIGACVVVTAVIISVCCCCVKICSSKNKKSIQATNPLPGSAAASTYPSSAASLEHLDGTVTPHSETTAKHHSIPPQQLLEKGVIKLAQMV